MTAEQLDYLPAPHRVPCFVNDSRADDIGPGAWSDVEVLTALTGSQETGAALFAKAGNLEAVRGMTLPELRAASLPAGMARRVLAAGELARRTEKRALGEEPLLTRADIVAAYMDPHARELKVEKFWVLCLNRKNRLLRRVEVTSGTATAALAHPHEVFRAAIRENASALVCCHNHPSGDPAPSSADVQITHLLREAAKTVEITLLDHVILGRAGADPLGRGYYSFRESGLI